ncbi:MAG: tRNA lysidine(34) synthetase TilS [Verrucomicrobia bacterium]|nr:tRNA lysidine(34) synthetase TilS [Verrucomicrobiota bacterium]
MKARILQSVKEFLKKNFQEGKPLLVGFSGGPDSTALVHALIECGCNDLHLCHIDHGWREESGKEAEKLQSQTKLPFHLFRLEKVAKTEDAARQARLKIFHQLYQKLGCQALVLGHQGDDQSETVLKRILEGAHLTSLGGILPVHSWEGMPIWRPLLQMCKTEIIQWLTKKNIPYLEDSTNDDPAYLRARMRHTIFPWLAKEFGKEIAENLRHLGTSAQELKKYLEARTQPLRQAIVKTKGHQSIDLNPFFPWEPLELKSFLKSWLPLSRTELESLCSLLQNDAHESKIGEHITVHRRIVAYKENF